MNKNFTAGSMMRDSRFSGYFKTLESGKHKDIEVRVERLIEEEREFCVPISRPHLCNLFSALAIYQSDLAEGVAAEESQDKIVSIMKSYLAGRKRLFQRLFKIPGIFPVMRRIIPKMMMKGNGHGWDTVEIDCGRSVCAFDTRQCIFATIFKNQGVPELGPCFCQIDDYLYSELPGIEFRRTGTCCRGDTCCDFRFIRKR